MYKNISRSLIIFEQNPSSNSEKGGGIWKSKAALI